MILIRFDDICPRMNWANFLAIKNALHRFNLKSILGVVPENHDPSLNVSSFNPHFYRQILLYAAYGDSIAQHGTYHLYTSSSSGILEINNNSEFAGHSFSYQYNLIKHGKQLLGANGIHPSLFMAPSHSFDKNTLKALSMLGFKYLTDGYGWHPYYINDILLIPQLAANYLPLPHSVLQTICLHTNTMTEQQVSSFIRFIYSNHSRIVSFDDVIKNHSDYHRLGFSRHITKVLLRIKRSF